MIHIRKRRNNNNSETETPLLTVNSNHGGREECNNNYNNKSEESKVDKSLAPLERFLKVLGYNHGSTLSSVTSWVVFLELGMVVQLEALLMCECSQCR